MSSVDATCFQQDLNLSTERLTSNKAFTNKLWNAGKFVLQNLPKQSDFSAWENLLAYKVFTFLHLNYSVTLASKDVQLVAFSIQFEIWTAAS